MPKGTKAIFKLLLDSTKPVKLKMPMIKIKYFKAIQGVTKKDKIRNKKIEVHIAVLTIGTAEILIEEKQTSKLNKNVRT